MSRAIILDRIFRLIVRCSSIFAVSTLLFIAPLLACSSQSNAEFAPASVVDWYHPPPEKYRGVEAEVSIPTELIGGVYPYRIDEATALLGEAEIVAITKEQANHLSFLADPRVVVQGLLEERREKLRFFLEDRPRSRKRYTEDIEKQVLESDQRIIAGLNGEIKNYEDWQEGLQPYLIKAVSFGATVPFFGGMVSDKLFVSHIGLGSEPLPMKRMPVVAYLPRRPECIYHLLSTMQ